MEEKIVPVIIPSLEPDDRLALLVRGLREKGLGPVVLLDDGSGEEYRAIYEECQDQYGCILLRHAVNLGKGRALKDAFNYCLNEWPNLIGCVTADSDGQHTPESIRSVRDAFLAAPDALVLGVRDFEADNVPPKSRLGNKLTCRVCSWVCGVKTSDTQTGLRAIPGSFMRELLCVPGERFEFETRMLVETKGKYPVREVSIETVYDSKDNHTTHFNPWLDSLRIYRVFASVLTRYIISSLSSGVIDVGLFSLMCHWLRGRFVMYVMAASITARAASATCNYLLNYSVVFHSQAGRAHSALRYCILAVCQMLVSASLVTLLCHLLPSGVAELWVKLPVDLVLFFASYVIQREYVYQKTDRQ